MSHEHHEHHENEKNLKIKLYVKHCINEYIRQHNIYYIPFIPKENSIGFSVQSKNSFEFSNEKETLITSIKLPCYGVWIIEINIKLKMNFGFSLLNGDTIKVKTDSLTLYTKKNFIQRNACEYTIICDSFTYNAIENELNIMLFGLFSFKLSKSGCVLEICDDYEIYNYFNLKATKIA
jgi:hypothetical protein